MKKTALLIMFIAVISKVLGFGRDVVLSYFYGASDVSDAYLIALTIPVVIFGFIGEGIATGYIPMYSNIEKEHGELEGNKYTSNLANIVILIAGVIFVLGFVFAEPMVKVFASGFKGETLELTVKFTRISLVGMYFIGLISIFSGFLELKGKYAVPAMAGIPFNAITIGAIVLGAKMGDSIMLVGTVMALAMQFLFLLPSVYKKGYRYRPILDIKDKYIVKMAYIAIPVIIGVSVNQINILVDRTIVSRLVVGGVSALDYAGRINSLVQGLFVMSIATAIYPIISNQAAKNNIDGFKKSILEAINSIGILVIPATVGAMVFSEPIVKLLFGRGVFDAQAVKITSGALYFYAIGMIGFGCRHILSRAFYSMQDTKTPAINAGISMILNIVLNILLSKVMGINGLAFATSISALFCTALMFLSLRKKIGPFGVRGIVISFSKVFLASIAMGVMSFLFYGKASLTLGSGRALAISIVIGALAYMVFIYILKVEEVETMIKLIRRKSKKE